ncbi:MAG: mannosyl-glycoprotein endo-beta-N-acetylglucosamidase [Epsilonproteobacteria bacterium]|nr:mannosyl-glycoprotein endo-beta-N-acetylglucosamidase [Campylobacterota bacterium]
MKKILLMVLLSTIIYAGGLPSWYYKIKDVPTQKKKFVEIMLPLIKKANEKTLKERKFVLNFFNKLERCGFSCVKKDDLLRLAKLSKKYKIKNLYDKYEYLLKIDKIPESLALTQAALESAWGKSRFARYANNIFGQWTFKSKGLVPEKREEGKTHKIKIFNSLQDSVDAYVANLNRNRAYKDFRIQRYQARVLNELYKGTDAAKTMARYSELRGKYVKMISRFMTKNSFLKYDTLVSDKEENGNLYALNGI